MKKHFLGFALCSLVYTAHAQVRFGIGPQVGYTLATAKYTYGAYPTDLHYRSGLAAGLLAEVGVGHLVVRPAILFAQKGVNLTLQDEDFRAGLVTNNSRTRIDYLVTPLHVGYAQHRNGQGLQVVAGVYYGFALGGHYSDAYTFTNNPSITLSGRVAVEANATSFNDRPVRRGDYGVLGGGGYRYHGLLAQLEYSWGLRNVDLDYSFYGYHTTERPVYYNRGFHLSLAYLFGPKA